MRKFIILSLFYLLPLPVHAVGLSMFLNLGYGAENHQRLCPAIQLNQSETLKSPFIINGEAGADLRAYASIHVLAGYEYTGCAFYNTETALESPYLGISVGQKKYFGMYVHKQADNPYSYDEYYYQARLGVYVTDTFIVELQGLTGKSLPGERKIRDVFVLGKIHF